MIPAEFLERSQRIERHDRRLGRHVLHDSRSRGFPGPQATGRLATVYHRVYNPRPLPEQTIGNCTGVAEAVQANTAGNRIPGKVLRMGDADRIYSRATAIDGYPGTYPPDDTGSDGLHAAKAALEQGIGASYVWYFGIGQVRAGLQLHPIAVGTRWHQSMFDPDPGTWLVHPDGNIAGGHEWTLVSYYAPTDTFTGLCWWGPGWANNGRFRIAGADLDVLLREDGDAHTTLRAK
jgi:hypothetical protein